MLAGVQGAVAFVPQDLPGGFNAPISWQDKDVIVLPGVGGDQLPLFSISWIIPKCRRVDETFVSIFCYILSLHQVI